MPKVICYNCNKPGHYTSKCPEPKNERNPLLKAYLSGLEYATTESFPLVVASRETEESMPKLHFSARSFWNCRRFVSFLEEAIQMFAFELFLTCFKKRSFLVAFRLPEDFGGAREDKTLIQLPAPENWKVCVQSVRTVLSWRRCSLLSSTEICLHLGAQGQSSMRCSVFRDGSVTPSYPG